MKILLIVPPERFDFYSYLAKDSGNDYVLLWHEQASQMKLKVSELPVKFSHVYYWMDFITPANLLKAIKPDKIIFYEIIDLRQIALNVAANAANITTFYLEHGAAGSRETAITRWDETSFAKHKLPYLFNRMMKQLPNIIKAKFFYFAVIRGFSSLTSYKKYFSLPFLVLGSVPNKVLSKMIFRERVPRYSIVFNEINLEEYQLYTGIEKKDALLTGVPYFDVYYDNEVNPQDHWVFIDHPYYEEGLLNWDKSHHAKIASALYEYANATKTKLYVKLHPRSNVELWKGFDNPGNFVEVIQFGDYTKLYLESKLILAYSSSLITGLLCACKNIVLLGWHPEPSIFGTDFSKTGLCHVSMKPEELHEQDKYWLEHPLCNSQSEKYKAYIKDFNEPFDGKATQRVLQAINAL